MTARLEAAHVHIAVCRPRQQQLICSHCCWADAVLRDAESHAPARQAERDEMAAGGGVRA
jgi:hypothetical protein